MNQYRCETCDFKGAEGFGNEKCPYDVQKSNEDNCDLIYTFRRSREELELMELCGLTCHSDLQSEREKVMDEVRELLKHEWNNANNLDREYRDQSHTTILHIKNQLEELRQGKVEK